MGPIKETVKKEMKKYNLAILFLFFLIDNINGTIIEVCPQCKFSSIDSAIKFASIGDTILIKSGIYKEHKLIINKSLHIIGEGKPVIDGEFKETIFKFRTDNFSIRGLKIINVGHSYTKDYAAIQITRSKDFVVENNVLEDVFFGILIEKSKKGQIKNNTISSNAKSESSSGNGIHIWHSSKMNVTENIVFHLRDGIYFEFVTNSSVSNNVSYENIRYGLHFMFSNNDKYFKNEFINNGAGVAVMFSKIIEMKNNLFKDNWGASSYGLLLKEIYDADIEDNEFIRNTTGITAEGSTRINYKRNQFLNNGWAVKISGACYENVFVHNNFLHNSFDLSYNSQLNDNKFEENYWSEYVGYDLDKDGIGDVPFRPVKLFSYIVNKTPETIVLLRSLFVDIINFSEKVSPVFTPDALKDNFPLMKKYK